MMALVERPDPRKKLILAAGLDLACAAIDDGQVTLLLALLDESEATIDRHDPGVTTVVG